ncbi:hypothetical protein ACFW04_014542 [Cataglyphis niger]
MKKLVLAQDTFNIENTEISSDESKEQRKKRRRIIAKKVSSSISKEDFLLKENKENRTFTQNKILPAFPQIEHFVPNQKSKKRQLDINEKCNIQFPHLSLSELTYFEDTAHAMIRNILKKVMANTLARDFSWAEEKNKRCFKNLGLTKLITREFILCPKATVSKCAVSN